MWPPPKSGYIAPFQPSEGSLRVLPANSLLPPPRTQAGLRFPGPQSDFSGLESPHHWKQRHNLGHVLFSSPRQVFGDSPGCCASRESFLCLFFCYGCTLPGCFHFFFFLNSAAIYILVQKPKFNRVNLKFYFALLSNSLIG